MAEGKEGEEGEVKGPQQPLPIFEVLCKSSGKIRRFAAGTEAGFAVNLINKRVVSAAAASGGGGGGGDCLLASHVEAVKEGEEEPISFGPTSLLVDYGSGWKLQTVIESNGNGEKVRIRRERVPRTDDQGFDGSQFSTSKQSSPISLVYIGKIVLAFLLLFVFGAAFTLLLENLPQFILYINSSM